MMRVIHISPSLLSADLSKLDSELSLARNARARYIHVDVMDGKFVPNITFDIATVKTICDQSKMINDVHIMIENPLDYAASYCVAGASILTFHLEACKDKEEVYKVINLIKSYNVKVGISIKPNTDVCNVLEYLKDIDLVLVMSVEPGKGGQKFMDNSLDKIKTLRKFIDENNLDTLIEVDGGINEDTSKLVKEAGVDILVAGSYLYGHDDFVNRAKILLSND